MQDKTPSIADVISELEGRIQNAEALFKARPESKTEKSMALLSELQARHRVFKDGEARLREACESRLTFEEKLESYVSFYRKAIGSDGSDPQFAASINTNREKDLQGAEQVECALISVIEAFGLEGDLDTATPQMMKELFTQYMEELLHFYLFFRNLYHPIPYLPKQRKKTA